MKTLFKTFNPPVCVNVAESMLISQQPDVENFFNFYLAIYLVFNFSTRPTTTIYIYNIFSFTLYTHQFVLNSQIP
nr:MAG TPA: hypothetical protein [Bacteriophage sp.]